MAKKLATDDVIENLIAAALGDDATVRQKYMYRESLLGLVRLAKSEQIIEIKENVRKLAGALEVHAARRQARAVLLAQRLPGHTSQAQQRFEFKR